MLTLGSIAHTWVYTTLQESAEKSRGTKPNRTDSIHRCSRWRKKGFRWLPIFPAGVKPSHCAQSEPAFQTGANQTARVRSIPHGHCRFGPRSLPLFFQKLSLVTLTRVKCAFYTDNAFPPHAIVFCHYFESYLPLFYTSLLPSPPQILSLPSPSPPQY